MKHDHFIVQSPATPAQQLLLLFLLATAERRQPAGDGADRLLTGGDYVAGEH